MDGSHGASQRSPASAAMVTASMPLASTPDLACPSRDTASPATMPATSTPLKKGTAHLDEAAINFNTLHLPRRLLKLELLPSPVEGAAGTVDKLSPSALRDDGDEPHTTLVTLFKPSPSATTGIVLSGEVPHPPIVSQVLPDGAAAAAAGRGEIRLGMELVAVNSRPVLGHAKGTRALSQLCGHAVLQLRTPPGPESTAARARLRHDAERLASLVDALLERDVALRLHEHTQVCAHPFFGEVDWVLLQAHELPAPFTPDPHLVDAKDAIAPLSVTGGGKKRSSEAARKENGLPELMLSDDARTGWDFVCDADAHALEVGEYVRKSTTEQRSSRAPGATRVRANTGRTEKKTACRAPRMPATGPTRKGSPQRR
jgi:hypothetical protein